MRAFVWDENPSLVNPSKSAAGVEQRTYMQWFMTQVMTDHRPTSVREQLFMENHNIENVANILALPLPAKYQFSIHQELTQ